MTISIKCQVATSQVTIDPIVISQVVKINSQRQITIRLIERTYVTTIYQAQVVNKSLESHNWVNRKTPPNRWVLASSMWSFGSFPPNRQSSSWDHFPQVVEVIQKVSLYEAREPEENDNTEVTWWTMDHLCGYQSRNVWWSPITWPCCTSPMYTLLYGLEQLSIRGNKKSTSSFHQMHSG